MYIFSWQKYSRLKISDRSEEKKVKKKRIWNEIYCIIIIIKIHTYSYIYIYCAKIKLKFVCGVPKIESWLVGFFFASSSSFFVLFWVWYFLLQFFCFITIQFVFCFFFWLYRVVWIFFPLDHLFTLFSNNIDGKQFAASYSTHIHNIQWQSSFKWRKKKWNIRCT